MTATAVTTKKERGLQLRATMEQQADQIAKIAFKGFTADRVISGMLQAAVTNPQILDCTPNTLFLALAKAARWGLDIGDGVHLVPFKKNIGTREQPQWVTVAEAVPDYRGLIALAMRQRLVRTIDAFPVYEGDDFDYQLGTPSFLRHRPCAADKRGGLKGAYIVILLPGGIERFHYLCLADIEKRRASSKSWGPDKFKTCPPWYAMKTVTRDWLNRQPKSGALAEAVQVDETESVEIDGETGEIVAPPSTAGLASGKVRQPPEEAFRPLDEISDEEHADLDRLAAAES